MQREDGLKPTRLVIHLYLCVRIQVRKSKRLADHFIPEVLPMHSLKTEERTKQILTATEGQGQTLDSVTSNIVIVVTVPPIIFFSCLHDFFIQRQLSNEMLKKIRRIVTIASRLLGKCHTRPSIIIILMNLIFFDDP